VLGGGTVGAPSWPLCTADPGGVLSWGCVRGWARSPGAHVPGVFQALLSVLHPWRVTSLPSRRHPPHASSSARRLLLLVPTACLRAASPVSALPGLRASPSAFHRVGVGGTPVHLSLSRASGNMPFVLTTVSQLQRGAGRVNLPLFLLLLLSASQPS